MTTVDGAKSGLYGTKAKPETPSRDRYFDALRAAAIVRIVFYHTFGYGWLSLIFPSMGVMFALGGSLMSKSVDRSAEQAITGRLRRLLPALWVFGAVVIPAMFLAGWTHRPDWTRFLMWAVPLVEPPSSEWAAPATGVLWYLVAYLWLVLLSPVLLRMYRRRPLATIIVPLILLFAWDSLPVPVGHHVGSAVTDVLTFTSCWVLGFAHRAGDLRKIRFAVLVPMAAVLVAAGLAWTVMHPGDEGIDLANEPIAYGIYSLGFTVLLMRISPSMVWLQRRRMLNGLVNFCNARAVTIYLWHNVAITFSLVIVGYLEGDGVSVWLENAGMIGFLLVLLAGCVAVFGWVEDVAARRPVQLLPWHRVPAGRPRKDTPEWCGPVWF
ncbi:acyltransferase [Actinoplanes sp. NPDC051633]|uniref:acyltransferase family protein n=1 Tax=Actinoplanes sp. NPDC051633 TaxID=3155670 RepID=UPI0034291FA2